MNLYPIYSLNYDEKPKKEVKEDIHIVDKTNGPEKSKSELLRIEQNPNMLIIYDENKNQIRVRWAVINKESTSDLFDFNLDFGEKKKRVKDIESVYPFIGSVKPKDKSFRVTLPFLLIKWKDGRTEVLGLKLSDPDMLPDFENSILMGNILMKFQDKEKYQKLASVKPRRIVVTQASVDVYVSNATNYIEKNLDKLLENENDIILIQPDRGTNCVFFFNPDESFINDYGILDGLRIGNQYIIESMSYRDLLDGEKVKEPEEFIKIPIYTVEDGFHFTDWWEIFEFEKEKFKTSPEFFQVLKNYLARYCREKMNGTFFSF